MSHPGWLFPLQWATHSLQTGAIKLEHISYNLALYNFLCTWKWCCAIMLALKCYRYDRMSHSNQPMLMSGNALSLLQISPTMLHTSEIATRKQKKGITRFVSKWWQLLHIVVSTAHLSIQTQKPKPRKWWTGNLSCPNLIPAFWPCIQLWLTWDGQLYLTVPFHYPLDSISL